MVIVKDISRLTRDKNKTGWYTEIFFPDNDIRFISVTEFIDSGERYEIEDSIMLRGIANQSYIADISKKVRSNKNANKNLGKFVEHYVPYGYKKDNEDKYKVIVDEEVKENIIKIYNMYINGKTSSQIAKYFNNNKVKTPSKYMKLKNQSKNWSEETINYILSNPFYIGNTVLNKYETNYIKKTCKKNTNRNTWIIKENTHEAIIEKEKYEKVQNIKANKKSNTNIKYEFLLKDLIYCGECKKKLQYKLYKINNSAGFICGYYYKKKCKNKTYISEKNLNIIVKNEVIKMLNLIETDREISKLIDYYAKNNEDTKKLQTYKKEQEKLERNKAILYNKKCENHISKEEFKMEYEKLKCKIQKYESLIEEVVNCKKQLSKSKITNHIKSENYITNEFLKEIISKIQIYSKNKIEITFNL